MHHSSKKSRKKLSKKHPDDLTPHSGPLYMFSKKKRAMSHFNTPEQPLPGPVSFTTPLAEVSLRIDATSIGESEGLLPSRIAAAPATCGAAIDVPFLSIVAVSDPIEALRISSPGAQISRQGPTAENPPLKSSCNIRIRIPFQISFMPPGSNLVITILYWQ